MKCHVDVMVKSPGMFEGTDGMLVVGVRKHYKTKAGRLVRGMGKYGLSWESGRWIRVPENCAYPRETLLKVPSVDPRSPGGGMEVHPEVGGGVVGMFNGVVQGVSIEVLRQVVVDLYESAFECELATLPPQVAAVWEVGKKMSECGGG